MKVVIALETLVKYDAIGHDVIEEYICLKKFGIETYIYAENFVSELSLVVSNNAIKFLWDKKNILIYHHSIFWENGIKLLKEAKCKKVVRYHNITPEHFFLPYSFDYFKRCFLGRRQTKDIINANIDLIFATSSFNSKDFICDIISENCVKVLPPFHRLHKMDSKKADIKVLNYLTDNKTNVFFIGRVAPNKGHVHIIYTAYYYKLLYGDDIRFIIAGSIDPQLEGYYKKLKELINDFCITNIVEFVGNLPFEQLKSYFLGSHVFLLLSEHEGFCVPILEAQYFKLPIIAYNSSAIRETLGENQLIYDKIDYEVFAASIYTLHKNAAYRIYLAQEGYKNFVKYEYDNVKKFFLHYLKELM